MDDWMQDMRDGGQDAPLWEGNVWPASSGRGVYFTNHSTALVPVAPKERVDRARCELIEATKALHPDVSDWRILENDRADYKPVGFFMIVGHPDQKAVL